MQTVTVLEHRVGQGKVYQHAPASGQGLHDVVALLRKTMRYLKPQKVGPKSASFVFSNELFIEENPSKSCTTYQ